MKKKFVVNSKFYSSITANSKTTTSMLEDLWKNNLLTPTKINIFNNNNINVMEDL